MAGFRYRGAAPTVFLRDDYTNSSGNSRLTMAVSFLNLDEFDELIFTRQIYNSDNSISLIWRFLEYTSLDKQAHYILCDTLQRIAVNRKNQTKVST